MERPVSSWRNRGDMDSAGGRSIPRVVIGPGVLHRTTTVRELTASPVQSGAWIGLWTGHRGGDARARPTHDEEAGTPVSLVTGLRRDAEVDGSDRRCGRGASIDGVYGNSRSAGGVKPAQPENVESRAAVADGRYHVCRRAFSRPVARWRPQLVRIPCDRDPIVQRTASTIYYTASL